MYTLPVKLVLNSFHSVCRLISSQKCCTSCGVGCSGPTWSSKVLISSQKCCTSCGVGCSSPTWSSKVQHFGSTGAQSGCGLHTRCGKLLQCWQRPIWTTDSLIEWMDAYNRLPVPHPQTRSIFKQKHKRSAKMYQGCSLGLERLGLEAVSRHFLERLVSSRSWRLNVSSRLGLEGWTSRSRLGLQSLEKSNISVSSRSSGFNVSVLSRSWRYNVSVSVSWL